MHSHLFSWKSFLAIFLSPVGLFAQAQVPIPEDFLPAGRAQEYLIAASQFLEKHAGDRFAPRVAFDLYTVSSSMGRSSVAEAARTQLLFHYPQSFQAGFLFSTFEDANDFRKFLNKQTELLFENNPGVVPEKFCQIFKIGLQRFKGSPELLGDFSILLKAFAFSQITQDTELTSLTRQELALKRIEVDDGTVLQTLNVCMDLKYSLLERVLGLHGIRDNADARFIKKIFMVRLPEEQKSDFRIIRIRAEEALRLRNFEESLRQIDLLTVEQQNDPQVLFWKARCQFSNNADSKAVQTLSQLFQSFPQSPWAPSARAYGEGILQLAANSQTHVDALHTMVQSLIKGMDVFQATLEFQRKEANSAPITIYVGVMQSRNYLELSVRDNAGIRFAYRTGEKDSALFLKEESKIYHFSKPGPIPSPRFKLEKKADGTFYISADASIEPSFKHAKSQNEGLLNSPFLKTPAGLRVLFDYSVRKLGVCPLPLQPGATGSTFEWIVPRVAEPQLDRLRFQLNPAGRLTGIFFPQFRLSQIHYGGVGEVQLNPPAWPEATVEKHKELDAAVFLRVFSSLAALAKKG